VKVQFLFIFQDQAKFIPFFVLVNFFADVNYLDSGNWDFKEGFVKSFVSVEDPVVG
jgi:hypothetical protein